MTSFLHRLAFWILIGIFSAVLAEVPSGSTLFPFFSVHGIFLILPLYTLHIVVLLSIIYRYGVPNLPTLYLGGMLFGLYEAFITKVLWNPPWPDPVVIAGVSVLSVVLLVVWWHALFSFIVPAIIGERILTSSSIAAQHLPKRFGKFFAKESIVTFFVVLLVLLGILLGAKGQDPNTMIAAVLINAFIVFLLVLAWRKFFSPKPITELLPTKKELIVLIGLLVLMYIGFSAALFTENFPSSAISYIVILLAYLVIGALVVMHLKKAKKKTMLPSRPALKVIPVLLGLVGCVIGVLVSSVLPAIGYVIGVTLVLLSFCILIYSVITAFRHRTA